MNKSRVIATLTTVILFNSLTLHAAQSAEPDPAVVVSVAPFKTWESGATFLSDSLEVELKGVFALLKVYLSAFPEIDRTRPSGVCFQLSEAGWANLIVFVPVTDPDRFIQSLEAFAETTDLGGGFLELKSKSDPRSFIGRKYEKWFCIAETRHGLDELPDDPSQMLPDLSSDSLIAARLNLPSVHAAIRSAFASAINEKVSGLTSAGSLIDLLRPMLEEIETLTVRCRLNRMNGSIQTDCDVVFRKAFPPAIDSARFAAELPSTNLTGFTSSQMVMNLHLNVILNDGLSNALKRFVAIQRAEAMTEIRRTKDIDLQAANEFTECGFKLISSTIEARHLNVGFALVGHGPYTAILGARTANTSQFSDCIRRRLPSVSPVSTYDGVAIYEIACQSEGEAFEAAKTIFGTTAPKMAWGFGRNQVFCAMGADPVSELRAILIASRTQFVEASSFGDGQLRLGSILASGCKITPTGDATFTRYVQELQNTPNDRIKFAANSIPGGVRLQFSVERGVITALWRAASASKTK